MRGKEEDAFQVSCGEMAQKRSGAVCDRQHLTVVMSLTCRQTDSYNRQAYYQPQAEQSIRRTL